MSKGWKIVISILAGAAVAVSCYFVGVRQGKKSRFNEVIVQSDTIILHDTITRLKPQYIAKIVTDTVVIPVHDTITNEVVLFREQKEYKSEDYRAFVSGIEPELDSIAIYPKTTCITTEKVREVTRKTRWGFGVSVGYAAGIQGRQIIGTPYVGLGISYNFICW